MAIDYDGASAGVFTRIGKLIKYIASYKADASTNLPADLKAIADLYEAADLTDQIDTLYQTYAGFQNQQIARRQALAQFCTRTLTDRTTVLDQLGINQSDIASVLDALHQKMLDDSETLDRSTVTLGTVTPASGNTGNGTVLVTKLLDGYSAPLLGARPNIRYNGLDSELAVPSETMTLVCTADSMRDGLQEGSEQFSWAGGIKGQVLDWRTEGSGIGPTLSVANGGSLIVDGSFENWSSNTPSNWTIDNGTAGVHVFAESGASNVYRGSYAAKFLGDGALALIAMSQSISASSLKSRRMYCVSVRIKASSVPASGAISVLFSGTGYTASGTEQISVAAGSFQTAWTLYSFFISMPTIIPSDWKLNLKVTGTLSNTVAVYWDSLACEPVQYHGGVGAQIVAGSTRFIAGDRFTFTVANDAAGTFQEFFRSYYRCQLPSAAGGGETIVDTLAL